jgi:spore coat polysaccharide biosynthesis protein SpsF
LEVILQRLRPAREVHEWMIATSSLPRDEPIARLSERVGVRSFRGSEQDCLDRFYHAAELSGADVVVRLTADNPLVDHQFLDYAVAEYFGRGSEFTSSALSGTYPHGLAVEVMASAVLAAAWREADTLASREHVTPYIYQHRSRFRVSELISDEPLGHLRMTVDTEEDLVRVRRVFTELGEDLRFSWRSAADFLAQRPEVVRS